RRIARARRRGPARRAPTGASGVNASPKPFPDAVITENRAWAPAQPVLSVLIPFFRYDPRPLLQALDAEAAALDGRVEIVILDDGGGHHALSDAVDTRIHGLAIPARFLRL